MMKTFNLVEETIAVNQVDFISAVNKGAEFAITYEGEIVTGDLETITLPVIFKGKATRQSAVSAKPTPITEALGKHYRIALNGPKLEIKASMNWQEIIGFNMDSASYDDTTGDGISHFTDREMEDMGWHATEFDITYRTMVEHLESNVEGLIFCIEQKDPYQFSGFGFFADDAQAREVLKTFLVATIKEKMATDEIYAKEGLDDDQIEALEFFGIDA